MRLSSARFVSDRTEVGGPLVGHHNSFRAFRKAGAHFENEQYQGNFQVTADRLWLPEGWQQLVWERKGRDWIDVLDLKKRTRAWLMHSFTTQGWAWSVSALCRFTINVENLTDGSTQGTILDAGNVAFTTQSFIDPAEVGGQRYFLQLAAVQQACEQWLTDHDYFDWRNSAAHWDEL